MMGKRSLTGCAFFGTVMTDLEKRFPIRFYRTASGREPVRDWLKELAPEDRRTLGEDLKTVEYGWPIGMPLCRCLHGESLGGSQQSIGSTDCPRPLLRDQ